MLEIIKGKATLPIPIHYVKFETSFCILNSYHTIIPHAFSAHLKLNFAQLYHKVWLI